MKGNLPWLLLLGGLLVLFVVFRGWEHPAVLLGSVVAGGLAAGFAMRGKKARD